MSWNSFDTKGYDGVMAETIGIKAGGGDMIDAYYARPLGATGPVPGIVLVHHLPGWDEFYREMARRFAQQGFATICPNLYYRFSGGTPDEATAAARAAGGVSDDSVLADSEAGADFLRAQAYSNGKVGVVGTCSGGRHAYMVACRSDKFDAIVDLWGGGVVQAELTPQRPVAPIDMTKDLNCPILGLFGNDDQNPPPDQVNQHEEALKANGKNYEFHRYDGAGHGFFYYHTPLYRQQQAMDGWAKVLDFFGKNLA